MTLDARNIYLCGVGGQGIGLLTETLGQACLAAGHVIHGCDTHGLAQRGGVVISHLRLGPGALTPKVPEGEAHLVIALERLEGLRAVGTHLRDGGALLYYDAVYQPIAVRMGEARYPSAADVQAAVAARNGAVHRVFVEGLADPRMQNSALMGRLAALEANLAVFRRTASAL
jgi:indolepyruvate ferredoxin oxidoreductase beta subunit